MREKSDPLDETLLERYVLNPEGLTGEERTVVEAHIQANPSSRAIAEYLRSFYEDFDEVDSDAAERIERLVEKFTEDNSSQ